MPSKNFLFFILLAATGLLVVGCNNNAPKPATPMVNKNLMRIDGNTIKTATGWGYQITVDNKIYINQPNIPAIAGDKSFTSAEDAAKVATLVISKMKQHQKPVILIEDLEALGIANQ